MEAFQIILPSPVLASYIRYYWILETDRVFDTPERIIPYGNIQLSFYSGAPIRCQDQLLETQALLCGQTTELADLLGGSGLFLLFSVRSGRGLFPEEDGLAPGAISCAADFKSSREGCARQPIC